MNPTDESREAVFLAQMTDRTDEYLRAVQVLLAQLSEVETWQLAGMGQLLALSTFQAKLLYRIMTALEKRP